MVITREYLHEQLSEALECVVCFCNNHKRIGKPFCFQCFDSLPANSQASINETMRQVNWNVHNSMDQVYDAARQWLRKYYSERSLSPGSEL